MKAKIGNHPNRLMFNLHRNYMNKKYGFVKWPTEQSRFENCLEWIDDHVQDFYNIFNRLWFDERQQKIKVRIDPWDTWSMDYTLAMIVLPMLQQLQKTKQGSPSVDDEDVPEELRSTSAPPKENEWDTDDNWHKRWDWVLDEMIYAFDCKANKDEVYMRFDVENKDEMQKEQERISNGFKLFGKYYEGLWD